MTIVRIRKTTIGEMNGGHSSSANNCYYKGSATVWEIMSGAVATGQGFKTKKLAQAVADYANNIGHDCWEDAGDIEMLFYSEHPEFH